MAGGAIGVLADKLARDAEAAGRPGVGTDAHGGLGKAAVEVLEAAHVEKGPLGDGPRAAYAHGLGAEEVCVAQRWDPRYAGQDGQEEHHQRAGDEDQAQEAERRVWIVGVSMVRWLVSLVVLRDPRGACMSSS